MSRGTSAVADMADLAEVTQIIKASVQLRAKFEEEHELCIPPHAIVPHPDNRGGDDIKPLRTKGLTATLATDGVDPVEANIHAVCVQVPPDEASCELVKKAKGEPDFQKSFESSILCDKEMAKGNMKVVAGSVSKSHLNCSLRNVFSSMYGCLCERVDSAVAEVKSCQCGNVPICDSEGRYNMANIRM